MIPTIDAPIQCQSHPRWRGVRLGLANFEGGDLGTYGCAVTCLSMLLGALKVRDLDYTPESVNEMLKAHDAFAGPWGTYVCWSRVPELRYEGRFDCPAVPLPGHVAEQMDLRLADGLPVIAWVDGSREAGLQQHFVLIVGKGEGGYVINDPYYGDRAPLCPRYGPSDEIAICGVVFFQK